MARDRRESDVAGAGRTEPAVLEEHGLGWGLEQLCGGGFGGPDQGTRRQEEGAAPHMQRAGAAMAAAGGDARRVALHEMEMLGRQAELLRQDLRKARLVPLAV